MELPNFFGDFLTEIRLTPEQIDSLKKGHETLRELLKEDEELSDIYVATFLQGSYRRDTIIRPIDNENPDVDVIFVTNLEKEKYTPDDVFNMFEPFLEKHYRGKWRKQGRSIGIYLDDINIDLVMTATPSESQENVTKQYREISSIISDLNIKDIENGIAKKPFEPLYEIAKKADDFLEKSADSPEWKIEPLYIPDRKENIWSKTHPLEQIRWTREKNKKTNKHYVNVVKALKWWKKEKYPDSKHPKSYPLEHFIGDCCPNGINYIAEGITFTLEEIAKIETKPGLMDRGVPEHDVFGRITPEEYKEFHSQASDAAVIAREALESKDPNESIIKWKELFGDKFRDPPQENKNDEFPGGRTSKSKQRGRRYG